MFFNQKVDRLILIQNAKYQRYFKYLEEAHMHLAEILTIAAEWMAAFMIRPRHECYPQVTWLFKNGPLLLIFILSYNL